MRSILLATLLAATMAISLAHAQTTGTTGTASATNSVTVMAVGTTPADPSGSAGGTGSSGTSHIKYSGSEYGTPSVQGSYFAGANPCLVGVGASGSGGPVGLSVTFGRNDEGCTRRSDAAAWHALGHDEIAMARMCQDTDNADAFFAVTGKVCPGSPDQRRYKTADGTQAEIMSMGPQPRPQPVAQVAYRPTIPNPAIAPQPTPNQVATSLPNDAAFPKPEWCARANPTTDASRDFVAATCH